jgi:hypothetical protein
MNASARMYGRRLAVHPCENSQGCAAGCTAQLLGSDNPCRPINPSNLLFFCFAVGSLSKARLFGSRPRRSPRLTRIIACLFRTAIHGLCASVPLPLTS